MSTPRDQEPETEADDAAQASKRFTELTELADDPDYLGI